MVGGVIVDDAAVLRQEGMMVGAAAARHHKVGDVADARVVDEEHRAQVRLAESFEHSLLRSRRSRRTSIRSSQSTAIVPRMPSMKLHSYVPRLFEASCQNGCPAPGRPEHTILPTRALAPDYARGRRSVLGQRGV